MKQYHYILLDWDGCLAKTLEVWLAAYKETFAAYGLYPKDKVISQEVFGDWNGPIKIGISDTEIDAFNTKLRTAANEKYLHVKLYEHAAHIIRELKHTGKKLALVTSSKRSTIQPALEKNHIVDAFDVILAADDVAQHKPDPEVITKAIEILHGTTDESVIIGDSKNDLGAGQNAGIDSILFYPEQNQLFYDLDMLKAYQPTYIINDFRQVLEIVK